MKNTVVFDFNGTLADDSGRAHLVPPESERHNVRAWDAFNKAVHLATPVMDNIQILRSLSRSFNIVVLTGCCNVARYEVESWLKKYGVCNTRMDFRLMMRGHDDSRPDTEVKEDALRRIGLSQIICCFDDIPRIAHHIRSLGVTCHLVTHYEKPGIHEE